MYTRIRAFGLFALSLLLSFAPLHAGAQAGSFIIAQHGTQVGTAAVTFSSDSDGLATSTTIQVSMKGLTYNLSKTERLSAANHLRHVDLSATVNDSPVKITAAPDAAQILLNISANGRASAVRLPTHPGAVFLPDFDPGALDTLLALAVAQNNRNLWAILPKQSGAAAASESAVLLATYADERGTLDGKPIEAHHLVATIAGARTDLFSGPENQLLQAELPQQGFAVIRKGFVLTPPSKAGAPPTPQQPASRPQPQPYAPQTQSPVPSPGQSNPNQPGAAGAGQ